MSFQFQINKKEGVICESFCSRSNLSNDDIISAYARSENEHGSNFGLKYCQDLENREAHPQYEFLRPPPTGSVQMFMIMREMD